MGVSWDGVRAKNPRIIDPGVLRWLGQGRRDRRRRQKKNTMYF
jgi:hypothetical protein